MNWQELYIIDPSRQTLSSISFQASRAPDQSRNSATRNPGEIEICIFISITPVESFVSPEYSVRMGKCENTVHVRTRFVCTLYKNDAGAKPRSACRALRSGSGR